MDSSNEPRATIISWALFLIFLVLGAGCFVMLMKEFLAGAVMVSTACLCLTLLARPS